MNAQVTVGFNATASSVEAVMWAASEAVARHLPLRVVTCLEMPMFVDAMFGSAAGEAFTSARTANDSDVARITRAVADAQPGLTVTVESSADPAAGVLLRGLGPDDLLVVGAARHDGVSAIVLGSTTRHVVRDSPCPVVVVRGAASRGRPDRIVVGVDGSVASERAVRWAGDEADRHQIGLVVVHGWTYAYAPDDARSVQARQLTEIDAACTLDRSIAAARARCGIEVTGRLVENSGVSALLQTIRDGDLLVLGSRGRGALRSRLFGSTVNSVLDTCTCPVVVVRADDETQPVSTMRVDHGRRGVDGSSDLEPVR